MCVCLVCPWLSSLPRGVFVLFWTSCCGVQFCVMKVYAFGEQAIYLIEPVLFVMRQEQISMERSPQDVARPHSGPTDPHGPTAAPAPHPSQAALQAGATQRAAIGPASIYIYIYIWLYSDLGSWVKTPYSYELLYTELKGLTCLVFRLKVCGSEHLTSNAKFT